jgi:hypothetical protein
LSNKTVAILIALGLAISIFAQQPVPVGAAASDPEDAAASIVSINATAGPDGVLIEWRTSYELNNVGFYVYREQAGSRVRVNTSIVPGSALILGDGVPLRGGNGYSLFDPAGTPDSRYSLESLDLHGAIARHAGIVPLSAPGMKRQALAPQAQSNVNGAIENSGQSSWPTAATGQATATGTIEDQWVIASQAALKIGVRQDGWYRLTQSQLVGAGLNPGTDAGNLRLFVNAREVPIRVSRTGGPLGPSDFIEFYATGIDLPWTGTQVYWLTGGTEAGRRIAIAGGLRPNSSPVATPAPPANSPAPAPVERGVISYPLRFPISFPPEWILKESATVQPPAPVRPEIKPANESPLDKVPVQDESGTLLADEETEASPTNSTGRTAMPAVKPTNSGRLIKAPVRPGKTLSRSSVAQTKKQNRRGRRLARRRAGKRNHADVTVTPATSFLQTVSRQERVNYYAALQNGEAENFFGQVLTTPGPTIQQLALTNIETSAEGPAQLEVALQGIGSAAQYSVFFNDVMVGTISLFYRDHPVASFAIPVASLREGNNDVKFVPAGGSGISFVDYVRVSFPHRYRADNNSLRFTSRFSQTVKVDGFTSSSVRVLDISDPLSVSEVRPIMEPSASGYALTIPGLATPAKGRRTLLAFLDGQFQQPASVTLNTPSSLNAPGNGADMVIISHTDFMASAAPLVSQRATQGLSVKTVNVEDVYDEFGYGRHDPYALRAFLSQAANSWATKPRYVILLGDASADPRNYQSIGSFDFVPTKIIDTLFLETASDDWLADFDEDGLVELAVGRLPARTVSEANIMISKIVDFNPTVVPQSALLVADAQGNYYFDFEEANTNVAALLPSSMTVETVNRRTEPSDAAAKVNIIGKVNAGQALVNYSGHGNINAWAGSILTSSDALALTNGNKLSFVVVMDCLNGYFIEPRSAGEGLAESFLKAPFGGAVAAFASSGETFPEGQHDMSQLLYQLLYNQAPMPLGDAIKQAKTATVDLDVRRTWVFFGDPSMKIR